MENDAERAIKAVKLSQWKRIAGVTLLTLLIGLTIAFSYKPSRLILSGWLSGDPCARGLPLRYWLDVLHYSENGNPRPDRRTKAAEALIAIGADAVPALTEILLTPDPPNVHSLLFEEKPFVPRKEAAWCLFRLGEPGRASFLDALRGLDHLPHVAAVRVLAAERPRPIEQLLEGALAHSKADKEHPLECVSHGRDAWSELLTVSLSPDEVDRLISSAVNTLGHPDPEMRWKATAFLWRVARWSPDNPQRNSLRPERLQTAANALHALNGDNDGSARICAAGALAALEKEHGIQAAK